MNNESLLKASVVCLFVGMGIIAFAPIFMVLRIHGFSGALGLLCIGMGFGAVGSILRKIYYMRK